MEYINIGKITSTHGIKGELKIKSDFKYKEFVFKKGNVLFIGNEHVKYIIDSYRRHKQYDMILLHGYNDINEVLKLIKKDVFYNKEDLYLEKDFYFNEDLIGLDVVFKNESIGKIIDIVDGGNGNELIKLSSFYIPNKSNFIKKIDLTHKKIYVKNVEGLIE